MGPALADFKKKKSSQYYCVGTQKKNHLQACDYWALALADSKKNKKIKKKYSEYCCMGGKNYLQAWG